MPIEANRDFVGVIILESLSDESIMHGITILQVSDIQAPPDEPYPVWSRRLVRIPDKDMEAFAVRLAASMKEDFYNHFVDKQSTLVVVLKGRCFFLDKRDKSTWAKMVQYGATVGVGSRWTMNIPVDEDELL
jgi:hypothetical protein